MNDDDGRDEKSRLRGEDVNVKEAARRKMAAIKTRRVGIKRGLLIVKSLDVAFQLGQVSTWRYDVA